MKTTSQMLSDEHQNILKVIEALLKECDFSGDIDKDFFKKAISFIRGYADKFHHAKEEDILFVELNKKEVKMHCNPTEQMLYEHDLGRGFIKELEQGVKEGDKDKVIKNAKEYAELLKEHIFKEDNILYPMADKALNSEIEKEMLGKFQQVEKDLAKEKEVHLSFLRSL